MQPLWKTVWGFLRKLKVILPCDLEIPLLGMYPHKTLVWKDMCTHMVIAALIAKTEKQSKSLLMFEWIMYNVYITTSSYIHIYRRIISIYIYIDAYVYVYTQCIYNIYEYTYNGHIYIMLHAWSITESCVRLFATHHWSPPGSSVYGASQARYWTGLPFPSPVFFYRCHLYW